MKPLKSLKWNWCCERGTLEMVIISNGYHNWMSLLAASCMASRKYWIWKKCRLKVNKKKPLIQYMLCPMMWNLYHYLRIVTGKFLQEKFFFLRETHADQYKQKGNKKNK